MFIYIKIEESEDIENSTGYKWQNIDTPISILNSVIDFTDLKNIIWKTFNNFV